MTPRLFPALAALSMSLAAATVAQAADPRGRYLTQSGNFEVELAPCGPALCGKVSKVVANHSMSRPGEAMQAADARDPMGLQLLANFVADGDAAADAKQWRGEIYNRENGKTYSCLMSLDERGDLVLRAYVGLPVFGKTQVWQRLSAMPGAPATQPIPSTPSKQGTQGTPSTHATPSTQGAEATQGTQPVTATGGAR
jgi:uncharacterized protein (DUF2147 family)